jgi:hypothetical protein
MSEMQEVNGAADEDDEWEQAAVDLKQLVISTPFGANVSQLNDE